MNDMARSEAAKAAARGGAGGGGGGGGGGDDDDDEQRPFLLQGVGASRRRSVPSSRRTSRS